MNLQSILQKISRSEWIPAVVVEKYSDNLCAVKTDSGVEIVLTSRDVQIGDIGLVTDITFEKTNIFVSVPNTITTMCEENTVYSRVVASLRTMSEAKIKELCKVQVQMCISEVVQNNSMLKINCSMQEKEQLSRKAHEKVSTDIHAVPLQEGKIQQIVICKLYAKEVSEVAYVYVLVLDDAMLGAANGIVKNDSAVEVEPTWSGFRVYLTDNVIHAQTYTGTAFISDTDFHRYSTFLLNTDSNGILQKVFHPLGVTYAHVKAAGIPSIIGLLKITTTGNSMSFRWGSSTYTLTSTNMISTIESGSNSCLVTANPTKYVIVNGASYDSMTQYIGTSVGSAHVNGSDILVDAIQGLIIVRNGQASYKQYSNLPAVNISYSSSTQNIVYIANSSLFVVPVDANYDIAGTGIEISGNFTNAYAVALDQHVHYSFLFPRKKTTVKPEVRAP